jgi:hypothetical protein
MVTLPAVANLLRGPESSVHEDVRIPVPADREYAPWRVTVTAGEPASYQKVSPGNVEGGDIEEKAARAGPLRATSNCRTLVVVIEAGESRALVLKARTGPTVSTLTVGSPVDEMETILSPTPEWRPHAPVSTTWTGVPASYQGESPGTVGGVMELSPPDAPASRATWNWTTDWNEIVCGPSTGMVRVRRRAGCEIATLGPESRLYDTAL